MQLCLRPALIALMLLLFCRPTAVAQAEYDIIDLTALIGAPATGTFGLSDSGHIIGTYNDGGALRSFVWKNGVFTGLGSLGGSSTRASDVNAHGQVVGYEGTLALGVDHAFLWEGSPLTDIHVAGADNSYAVSVNDSGVVVGNAIYLTNEAFNRDTVFVRKDGATTLLPVANVTGASVFINNRGSIAGYRYPGAMGQNQRSFLYKNAALTDLGSLPNSNTNWPVGINDSDQVAGISGSGAYIWKNGTMSEIVNGFGGNSTNVRGINNAGQVVGSARNASSAFRAYVWKSGVMTDLTTLVDPDSGWTALGGATAINNAGEIIGVGTRTGFAGSRGFLLKPRKLKVLRPVADERWNVGEPDTIRWRRDVPRPIEIRFSDDGGLNYTYVTTAEASESTYVWFPPEAITTSSDCMILLTDALDASVSARSGRFTLRAYDLARPVEGGGALELFSPSGHGWSFANEEAAMWPASWYSHFDYPHIIDVHTGLAYSTRFIITTGAEAADLPDWQLFAETFGFEKCYSFKSPTEAAMRAWKAVKEPWKGACFGFPTSALLAFDLAGGFFSQHEGIPQTSSIYTLFLTNTIRNAVLQYYLHQNDIAQIDHLITSQQAVDVRDLLAELKVDLLDATADHKTLSMLHASSPRAHTLIPFKLRRIEESPEKFQLLVYDCNSPGQNGVYIELDSLNNTWEEFTGLDYPPASSGLFLNLPISHFLQPPLLDLLENPAPAKRAPAPSSSSGDRLSVYASAQADVFIVSPLGDSLGYGAGGRYPRNIPGAVPLVPSVAVEHAPIGYQLPDGAYRIALSAFRDSALSILLHDESMIFSYEREDGDSAETDVLTADNGLGVASHDAQSKNIRLAAIIPATGSELTFEISQLALNQDDSVDVRVADGNSLRLLNAGGAKTYHLHVGLLAGSADAAFEHDGVVLPGNATHFLVPADSALSAVTVLSDLGSDGSIDDSTRLTNEVTGVRRPPVTGVPGSFALYQNFPNPFNPSTEITYDLSRAGHVTLRVYDLLGREIATLVDGEEAAGSKTVRWDAAAAPGGIYFCRLTAGDFSETRKLALVK